MTKLNMKTPVVFYVGLVLLCLFMFSLYLSGGMYARYATTDSGGDGARVAKFDVTVTGDMTSWHSTQALGEMYPGAGAYRVEFDITNNSEVAVALQIYIVNMTGNLPLNIPYYGTDQANTPVYSSSLAPGAEAQELGFDIKWDDEADNNTDPAYSGKTDVIQFRVQAVQVD